MANTYSASTDLIVGDDLILYVQENGSFIPIAYAKSHTLSLDADSIDTSSKFSGKWKSGKAGQLGWTIESDSLVSNEDGHMSFKKLSKMAAKQSLLAIKIATRKPTPDVGDDPFEAGTTWLTGSATITSIKLTASNGEVCTSSISLIGDGALKNSSGVALDKII